MASYKHNREEEDILREMTAILRELKDPRIDPLLSVVHVELSRDMSACKIYVSSLSGLEMARQSCQGLDSAKGYVRRELFTRLGLRKSPQLYFIADDSIAAGAKIDEMIEKIQAQGTEEK